MKKTHTYYSEFIHFTCNEGQIEFGKLKEGRTETTFQISGDTKNLRLGCILKHPSAIQLSNFLSNLSAPPPRIYIYDPGFSFNNRPECEIIQFCCRFCSLQKEIVQKDTIYHEIPLKVFPSLILIREINYYC